MAVNFADYVANQQPSQIIGGAGGVTGSLEAGQKNLASSYETFLSLLTAQLKNQDPTAPMDTNSFTQQLVQMTGVQQQLLSNQLLKSLVDQGSGDSGLTGAVGLIGKTVTAQTSVSGLKDGEARWTYELDTPAVEATLTVSDANGRAVWSGPAPARGVGEHEFVWDGKDAKGNALPEGAYKLSIKATDTQASEIATRIFIKGVAGALSQSNGQTVVSVGAAQTPLSTITAVSAT